MVSTCLYLLFFKECHDLNDFCEFIVGILEELDDSLEFDCSFQSSTDSETDQYEYANDVESETGEQKSQADHIHPILKNQSKRPQKTPKTNKRPKTYGMNPKQ